MSNQKRRIIVVTSSLVFCFAVMAYGVKETYGINTLSLISFGVVTLVTIGIAIVMLRLTGKAEREGGVQLVQAKSLRLLAWCGGAALVLKLLSLAVERLAA